MRKSGQIHTIGLLLFAVGAATAASQNTNSAVLKKAQAYIDPRGYVLRVKVAYDDQWTLIESLERAGKLQIWKRLADKKVVDVMVSSATAASVKAQLKKVKANVQVTIANVEAATKEEKRVQPSAQAAHRTKIAETYNFTFTKYHRLDNIYGYLDYLAKNFPKICTVQDIGSSILGTPIKMIKISGTTNPAKHSFIIEGGIHAREWISPASVAYIIKELVENRDENAFAQSVDFYVVPVTNPDGYEYTHTTYRMWRKNRRDATGICPGVDLNRNFGYNWGGLGASNQNCDETYYGAGAFSEPESQAIRDFVSKIGSSAKAYIAFHSYGQYILYPWGYDRKLTNDTADLDRVGKKIAANIKSAGGVTYTVGNSAILLYPAAGGSDDWAKGGSNIKYSYTIELRDTKSFLLPTSMIVPTGKDAFVAVKTLAEELIAGSK